MVNLIKFLLITALTVTVVVVLLVSLAFATPRCIPFLLAPMFFGAGGMAALSVWQGIARGELKNRAYTIFRDASPIRFWIQIAGFILMGAFCFLVGFTLLGLAPHWFIAFLRSHPSRH